MSSAIANRARVVVVGSGRMGRIRSSIANASPKLELVGIVDPDLNKAKDLAATYQVTPFASLSEAFSHADHSPSSPKIDGVVVCSPTYSHAEVIQESADFGVNVFTEKPVDETADKIQDLFQMTASKQTRLCCGFQRRFDMSYQAAVDQVKNQRSIGKPLMANIFFADHPVPSKEFLLTGGNIFFDLATHDVDYILHCLDDDDDDDDGVESVYATGTSSDSDLAEAGVHDNATMVLTFRKGTVVTLFLSRSATYGYDQRVEIFGTEGHIRVGNIHENSVVLSNASGVHHSRLQHSFPQRFEQAFSNELNAFGDTLLDGTPWPITAEQCINVQKVTDAASLSCETGKIVYL